ncbi:hypothetical protein H0H87_002716 [Tephrocybe sp. NHM501043]|nr:hypothetical protein H0H87_002716 [Tephrocybe sp. NHM501043]
MASATQDVHESRIKLPGFGLRLDYNLGDGPHQLFINALDNDDLGSGRAQLPLTTLREFEMLKFMNVVTDKPNWHEKVFDDSITSKWREEALSEDVDITNAMINWCISELRYKTKEFLKTGAVSVFNGDVVKSDYAIPKDLQEALKAAVAPLEQVPHHVKDWHPDSDNLVLDLVHPSLFPLIYGRTRILPYDTIGLEDCIKRSGEGIVVPVPPESENGIKHQTLKHSWQRPKPTTPFSRRFQWLPCDVDISDSARVRIKSYINNLHPQAHTALYSVIEEIIFRTIPLWNMSLRPLKDPKIRYKRIDYTDCVYDPDPEFWPLEDQPQQGDDENEDDFIERREEWFTDNRVVIQPEPGPFEPPVYNDDLSGNALETMTGAAVDLRRDYGNSGLQIIVKLANIHLTPEQPLYKGGSWHVEGQLVSSQTLLIHMVVLKLFQNEHICASAIYYYDSENITTSRLAFRQQSQVFTPINYRQDHHDWLEDVFGCQQNGPGVQDSGIVNTPEGRLLTWPNVLQHQVQPFRLEDPEKPGHRKILALFLIDPNIRITSTANVPCQQRDWWGEELRRGAIPKLPLEVQDQIFKRVDEFPISLNEAKEMRLELMDEKSRFVYCNDQAFSQHTFNLCEH